MPNKLITICWIICDVDCPHRARPKRPPGNLRGQSGASKQADCVGASELRVDGRHVRAKVMMTACSLAFERVASPISSGYIDGGGILLGLFILEVTLWGIAWCWGARKREALRRSIVDRQLAQIRAMEQAEEERDLAE